MCTCKFRNIATAATQPTATAANAVSCRAIAALHPALVNTKHLPEGLSRRETRTCREQALLTIAIAWLKYRELIQDT